MGILVRVGSALARLVGIGTAKGLTWRGIAATILASVGIDEVSEVVAAIVGPDDPPAEPGQREVTVGDDPRAIAAVRRLVESQELGAPSGAERYAGRCEPAPVYGTHRIDVFTQALLDDRRIDRMFSETPTRARCECCPMRCSCEVNPCFRS